jgi:hypothetical protein
MTDHIDDGTAPTVPIESLQSKYVTCGDPDCPFRYGYPEGHRHPAGVPSVAVPNTDAPSDAVSMLMHGSDLSLDQLLVWMHSRGWWFDAFYPLSEGTFECRLTCGRGPTAWAVSTDALEALRDACKQAAVHA